MNYIDAFNKMVNQYGLDVLNNNHLVRSFLFDLVCNKIPDSHYVNAYCQLNITSSIFNNLNGKTLAESKKYIKGLIGKADKTYSLIEYIKSVEPLLLIVYPDEYKLIDETKITKLTTASIRISKANNKPLIIYSEDTNVVQQKSRKTITKPDTISINAQCQKLEIKYNNCRKPKLLNHKTMDITQNSGLIVDNKTIKLNLIDKNKIYYLELPRTKYKNVDIDFSGKELFVHGDSVSQFKAEQMNINADRGNISICTEFKTLVVQSLKGKVSIRGSIKYLTVNGDDADIYCSLDEKVLTKCELETVTGDIRLNFLGSKIKPKVIKLFRRCHKIQSSCRWNGRIIDLLLWTGHGNIIAK